MNCPAIFKKLELAMHPALPQTMGPTREFAIASLTGNFRIAADNLPADIASMTLEELEAHRTPTEVDYFLRRNLWRQVELVHKGIAEKVEPVSVYSGVCSKQNYEMLSKNMYRVAWLLTSPLDSRDRAEAGLSIGITNLLKFVAREPTAETASAFLKAIEMLWNRVHGPVVTKIESKHAHINMNKPIGNVIDPGSRIEELKSKLVKPLVSYQAEIDAENIVSVQIEHKSE